MNTFAWGYILVPLLVLVVAFIICRELICWYWKINKAIELLETIARNTAKNEPGQDINKPLIGL